MARIAYSMAGEGRGHATRAKTIIDHLIKRQHQLLVFAPEFAFHFLDQVYRDETRVNVQEIPGLMFHYRNERLTYRKTAVGAVKYLWNLPRLVRMLQDKIEEDSIELAITDFEPALPRAAQRLDIPWISIDHQHFLVVSDFRELPLKLRVQAWGMAQIVKNYHDNPLRTVVSSFYFPKVKPHFSNVVQTGVLLRDQVVLAQPVQEEHFVVYLRRFADRRILEALACLSCEVRIYGLGLQRRQRNLRFREISESGFLEDLRSCRALISNAGNQLVGEALFLRKPVFVFPEQGNFEQEINARYLALSGGGDWCQMLEFTPSRLAQFEGSLDQYVCQIPRTRLNGNNATLQVIESLLPNSTISHLSTLPELVTA